MDDQLRSGGNSAVVLHTHHVGRPLPTIIIGQLSYRSVFNINPVSSCFEKDFSIAGSPQSISLVLTIPKISIFLTIHHKMCRQLARIDTARISCNVLYFDVLVEGEVEGDVKIGVFVIFVVFAQRKGVGYFCFTLYPF